ncbi:helix-turn-helix domain-containing protein [Thermus amyloliquefaciens]|uniref:helix-turn-helix domain-containing protein n=1 Tax=Thermus amyloliquefaciens TaxID=1449080 RepID=UPI000570472F|nr:helix-turn-helix transcriptional regulator [Thermus amyloliquefaciens]
MDFRDYYQESLKDPESARLYREVLDEELSWLLSYLREHRGLSQKEVAERLGVSRSRVSQMETSAGLSMTLEGLARYAQALGLSLRLEFTDEEGEVLARFHLGADEPVAEPVTKTWEPVAEAWVALRQKGKRAWEEIA